jgi:hypothetical protein
MEMPMSRRRTTIEILHDQILAIHAVAAVEHGIAPSNEVHDDGDRLVAVAMASGSTLITMVDRATGDVTHDWYEYEYEEELPEGFDWWVQEQMERMGR